jgi:PAS domain S-box-containing protein
MIAKLNVEHFRQVLAKKREITKGLGSLYIDLPALRPGTAGAYVLAFVAAGVATALRLAIDPYVVGDYFSMFYPAVLITTLISGLGAGLFCFVLSGVSVWFFLLPPRFSFYIYDTAEVVSPLLLFALASLFTVTLITWVRSVIEREWVEQASKDRLRFALDAALLGWWQYDPHRCMASGDAHFKEIFDLTTDEIPVGDIKKLVHPDDAERFWADRQASLDPANPNRSAHEYRVRRRDGEVHWVEVHWLAHRAKSENIIGIGVVRDITNRKKREERERMLVQEINHRSKNLLYLVDAVAHQTAAEGSEEFVERFSERLRALSANQDLLVQNEWHGVGVEALVRVQLAHFADLIGYRVTTHGPELRVNAEASQSIGLALHELATNAAKYGALSTDTGRVDICWGADGNTFTMNWMEREGPRVSAPQRRGYGTMVIEEMAKHNLDGAVQLDYPPSGLTWRLTCPAANVLEAGET